MISKICPFQKMNWPKRSYWKIRDRSQKVKNFRIPRARHIFELGQEKEALRIIIESKRVDPKAREKAKEILAKENIRESSAWE